MYVARIICLLSLFLSPNAPQEGAPAQEKKEPSQASGQEARRFLKEKVDKTMYNIVSQGAETVMARFDIQRSPMELLNGRPVLIAWRKEPALLDCKIPGIAGHPQQVQIETQMRESFSDLLLLPASSLDETVQASLEKDGDLVKISLRPADGPMNAVYHRWFTPEGKLIKARAEMEDPRQGPGVQETSYELKSLGEDGSGPFVVVKYTQENYLLATPDKRLRNTAEVSHAKDGEFTVVATYFNSSKMGETAIKCQVKINQGLDPSLFGKD